MMPWWYYGDYGDYAYPADTYTTDYASPTGVTGYASSTPIETATESDYYARALEAFHEGSYATAERLAGHAAVDNPRDPNVHLLLSLSMFALGNYHGAAAEAHAVAAFGAKVDRPSLIGFYDNKVGTYASQMGSFGQAHLTKNPSSTAARFLLGFHYLAEGHKDAAQTQLLAVVNAVPPDRITADLLVQAGGRVPESVAQRLKENPGHEPGQTPGFKAARQRRPYFPVYPGKNANFSLAAAAIILDGSGETRFRLSWNPGKLTPCYTTRGSNRH